MTGESHTPARRFRIPDDIYHAAQERARVDGTTVSAVVRAALRAYIEREASDILCHRCGSKAPTLSLREAAAWVGSHPCKPVLPGAGPLVDLPQEPQ